MPAHTKKAHVTPLTTSRTSFIDSGGSSNETFANNKSNCITSPSRIDNQAIVIPETIDAIRALTGIETDPARSIAKTDASLGLRRDFLR